MSIKDRERSLPIKWVDLVTIDPEVLKLLKRGKYQEFIPVTNFKPGGVAMSSYPSEDFDFSNIDKKDLTEVWEKK